MPAPRGLTQYSTIPSCKTLLDQSLPPSTGIYWINPEGVSQSNAFKVYCDMEDQWWRLDSSIELVLY